MSSTGGAGLESGAVADYWQQARQPLVCLVFLLPLLAIYEAGVFWLGGANAESFRNGADYWMRHSLLEAGFGQVLLLPALVVAGLLVWQVAGKYPWQVTTDTLAGMLAESLLFAFFLVVVGQMHDMVFQQWGLPTTLSVGGPTAHRIVAFVGAGVYEEFLFRLLLLPACFGLFRVARLPVTTAAVLAILMTSLVFSGAHYVGAAADQFTLFTFSFRMLAGLFFSALFVLRGFGITVGCHAAYDLIVGWLLVGQS
jgi:hypothetical protein